MADKKISQLTSATTPLAGTETLPIVQGGSTVKVSVDNLTAGKPVAASQIAVDNNSSNPAVRITQTGAGNALVVEDSANPDASPFVIDASGNVAVGKTTASTALDVTNNGASGDTLWVTGGGSTQARFIQSSSTGYVAIGARSSTSSMIGSFRTDAPYVSDLVLNPDGGNVKVGAGNLVLSTAGKGIDFSANTHAAGMTSEVLNWYEEGDWTPSVTSTSGTLTTVGAVSGKYTRIGRRIFVTFSVAITTNGTGAGSIRLAGLPFAISGFAAGSGRENGVNGYMIQSAGFNGNSYFDLLTFSGTYPGGNGYLLEGFVEYNV